MDIISYDGQANQAPKITINNETTQDSSIAIINKGSSVQDDNCAVQMYKLKTSQQ